MLDEPTAGTYQLVRAETTRIGGKHLRMYQSINKETESPRCQFILCGVINVHI